MAGTLFIVATPIGNLDDISARALRILREVSLIAAEDTRRTNHLLQRYGLTTRSTSFHEHNAKSKAPELIDRLLAGESIAVVTDAGTPGVSDPGQELVVVAHERQIPVVPIPGPSAVTAALSVCGFPGDGFVFLGFPPSKGPERRAWFERFAAARGVVPLVVFYEAPHRIQTTLGELGSRFGRLPICVGRELTKVHEFIKFGYLTEFSGSSNLGEFVVVVNIGDSTKIESALPPPEPGAVAEEFSQMTKTEGVRRRQAISALSRKYGLPAREIYAMVEASKSTV
ncbi:MAG: 16S rRNA (cytidine(1402)-2'-O)-methyltransferase [Vicinamibacterales bacterium]